MTAMPNRMSAFGHLSPQRELELAQELLGVQSEEELDRFLPLLLPAIKAAAPLLKSVAGSLLGGLGGGGGGGGGAARGRRRRRPASQEEYFLGNIVKGLLGEMQPENEQEEQFLGRIRRVLRGAGGLLGEEEQFIGGLIGKLFGGRRELEAETPNYVQEQFIGGLIGRLFGGRRELESEAEMGQGSTQKRLGRARRFVRLAHAASQHAAQQLSALGRRPTPDEARRVILDALFTAARRFTPKLASALAAQPGPAQRELMGEGEGSMLEMMLAAPASASPSQPRPRARGRATWVRRGDSVVFSL